MPQNFIACDRGQLLMLPPSLVDWVPDDHLVWSILGAVEQMDLTPFMGRIARMVRAGRRMSRR